MALFDGRYRVETARLKGYDYASPGAYFVTVCTAGMVPFLGEIRDGQMHLSATGRIVHEEMSTMHERLVNASLDEWVIMPDHLHAVVFIEGDRPGVAGRIVPLAVIVGQFKARCTKRVLRAGHPSFAWQHRFYDHIIRGEEDLDAIRQYIMDNPARWAEEHEPVDACNQGVATVR